MYDKAVPTGLDRERAACCGSKPRSTMRRVQGLPYPGGQARGDPCPGIRMRKGIADLHRRAEVSQAANDRYLQALASVDDTTPLGELAARLCQPAKRDGRRVRSLNPYAPADARLLEAIGRASSPSMASAIATCARCCSNAAAVKAEQRRQAAAVSRRLALLRAHRLIKKVPAHTDIISPPGPHHRNRADLRAKLQHRGTYKAGSVRKFTARAPRSLAGPGGW